MVVDVEFAGSDPDRQRAWAHVALEALQALEALENEPDAYPGGISAHFHLTRRAPPSAATTAPSAWSRIDIPLTLRWVPVDS
ncbi:hypothetical protein OG241_42160 [Streptomyces sp. NBC_01390]|uniref:hypothetical protein n=1 Tax=Streptomyces sp. NBC_01390 TaxID=2903850 RepID=UPI0032460880